MTKANGRLEAIGPCSWQDLGQRPMDKWLWMDTDVQAHGIHLVDALPPDRPAEVTHVWAWSKTAILRARVDIDLPDGGVVGSVLHLAGEGPGDEVAYTRRQVQLWNPSDGRIGAVYPAELTALTGEVHSFEVVVEDRSGAQVSLMPLTFLAVGWTP